MADERLPGGVGGVGGAGGVGGGDGDGGGAGLLEPQNSPPAASQDAVVL
jgi:hypothetical protein